MLKERIAELHALERSPIAKKLWFFIHLRNLEVSWPYFRPSTPLKGLALATSCSATFWQLCHFEQLLILGANLLNFKQLMAIKKPYNTVKSCYAIYARKKISVLSTLFSQPTLWGQRFANKTMFFKKWRQKSKFQIVKGNKFLATLPFW